MMLIATAGCSRVADTKPPSSKESPAKVEALPKEANLAEVRLTSKAYDRLGITTARVERQQVTQVRKLAGEVTIPPGELAVIVAPFSGTIQLPADGSLPKPGSFIEKGRTIFKFMPLLTPERFVPTPAERAQIAAAQASLISLQMAADGDVKQFTEEVAAARIALNRAETLQRDRVGSKRAVDDAKALHAIAEARLMVANNRKKVLGRLTAKIENGAVSSISSDSPLDGIVRSLPVVLGQLVSTGTTLCEVVNLDTVWIRVPVYVGLLGELNLEEPATINFFGDRDNRSAFTATPVKAPPAADPISSTADLFYTLSNEDGRFRPGERVSVTLTTSGESESLVIPAKAVLYDIYGGTWVYLRVDKLHFRRARIVVRRTTKDIAVLKSGPPEGSEIVVDGAAELFGTEFGIGK